MGQGFLVAPEFEEQRGECAQGLEATGADVESATEQGGGVDAALLLKREHGGTDAEHVVVGMQAEGVVVGGPGLIEASGGGEHLAEGIHDPGVGVGGEGGAVGVGGLIDVPRGLEPAGVFQESWVAAHVQAW